MNYEENVRKEFATIDLLLPSNTTTGRTDAFILAYVKHDKQIRKIFTYLVYQFEAFSSSSEITEIIADKRLYPDNFIKGFDALYNLSFAQIIGEGYEQFRNNDLKRITNYRNKILHGQVTGQGLDKEELTAEVELIRNWMLLVAEKMSDKIEYDGIERNSFKKSSNADFLNHFKKQILSKAELEEFITNSMKAK